MEVSDDDDPDEGGGQPQIKAGAEVGKTAENPSKRVEGPFDQKKDIHIAFPRRCDLTTSF